MKGVMKLRNKYTGKNWHSSKFNIHGLGEIIVHYPDYGADSAFIREFDVYLVSTGEWKDMNQAFKDHDLITDNYNTRFFEPKTEEDRIRGFTLD